MTMESNDLLRDILIHTDTGKLKQFVNEYANDHADFRDVFLEKFSPKPKPKPGSKHKQPEEDYPRIIKKARYYLRHDNREEAIHIAQNLIDTIPDYWDENFDYEGDVRAIRLKRLLTAERYDDAIRLLQEGIEIAKEKKTMGTVNEWRKELFSIYLQYVQQQATITDKVAYKRVGQTLIWMKSFEGGTAVVRQLINQFRETYKRRPYMMKELDRVF